MAEAKTQPTDASVDDFLEAIAEPRRRADAKAVDALMRELSGEAPQMWGSSIVGYGRYDQVYANGRTAPWPRIGFSPRKSALVLYLMPGFEAHAELLQRLGRHTTGQSCLYLKKLDDADPAALRELIADSLEQMRRKYPPAKATR